MSLVLVFPGQGAQYVGMGKALAEACAPARALLAQADAALGFSLSKIMAEGQPEPDAVSALKSRSCRRTCAALSWDWPPSSLTT